MPNYIKFYDFEKKTGIRRLFTFRVNNREDALKCLVRFNVKAGYYNGEKIVNPYYLFSNNILSRYGFKD